MSLIEQPTLWAIALVFGVLLIGLRTFARLRRRVRFERKLDKATSTQQKVDHDEALQLLESAPQDVSVDKTIYRFFPTLSRTRVKMRRAGINLDIKVYVFGILALATGVLQFYKLPIVPDWSAPIILVLAFHLVINAMILPWLISRRKEKMISQLAEAIEYMGRGLQVGQSIESALYEAKSAIGEPLSSKLAMAYKLNEVGISMQNSLETVAIDIDLPEFDFFVSAVSAQLQTGGSIVASLQNIVDIIRARKELQAKVAALSAEGKMSAYVLSFMPVGIFAYLKFTQPDYLDPLMAHPWGSYILAFAAGLVVFGFAVMMWLAKIKV